MKILISLLLLMSFNTYSIDSVTTGDIISASKINELVGKINKLLNVEILKYKKEIIVMIGSSSGSNQSVKFKTVKKNTSQHLLSLDNSGNQTKVTILKDNTIVNAIFNTRNSNDNDRIAILVYNSNNVEKGTYSTDWSPQSINVSVSLLLNAGDYILYDLQRGAIDDPTKTFMSITAESNTTIKLEDLL